MGFIKKLRSHFVTSLAGGLNLLSKKQRADHRHSSRYFKKKLGLSSRSKFGRQLKRGVKGLFGKDGSQVFSPAQATSAGTVYQHQAKTLSQMTGGV